MTSQGPRPGRLALARWEADRHAQGLSTITGAAALLAACRDRTARLPAT